LIPGRNQLSDVKAWNIYFAYPLVVEGNGCVTEQSGIVTKGLDLQSQGTWVKSRIGMEWTEFRWSCQQFQSEISECNRQFGQYFCSNT
jgi:hypothetical protein